MGVYNMIKVPHNYKLFLRPKPSCYEIAEMTEEKDSRTFSYIGGHKVSMLLRVRGICGKGGGNRWTVDLDNS